MDPAASNPEPIQPPASAITSPASAVSVGGVGIAAGFLSGLFGVGGGVIIVPALVAILGMDRRRASATSLLSIILTASIGAISYGIRGDISIIGSAILVCGALIGTYIGTKLLRVLPAKILPWTFVAFIVIVIISQQFHIPTRGSELILDPLRIVALIGIGLLSGVFAGLVGVGGGSIIVPGMQLCAGVGDLLARGTSLLVMIPTAISGTWSNSRYHLVDWRTGLVLGICAAAITPLGAWVAALLTPQIGTLLFTLFLIGIAIETIMRSRRSHKN
ncbi:MAG: sulfite exporter TauE/SafE family protein [Actinomycetaceae bacterium]|nr:sulfite exporter TauE/SafE family protein [Actinomycetaceae bacterium]